MRTSPTDNVILGDVWSYSLADRVWKRWQHATGPLLAGHTAVTTYGNSDVMVVFGGSSDSGQLSNHTWLFETVTGQWNLISPSGEWPAARDFHTAAAIPSTSRFEMWGGIPDTAVWTFDQLSHSWSSAPSGQAYESGRSGTVLQNRALISFGGLTIVGPTVEYNNQVQYRANLSWANVSTQRSGVPVGRCYAGLVSVDDSAYMIGGYRRQNGGTGKRLNDAWRLKVNQ